MSSFFVLIEIGWMIGSDFVHIIEEEAASDLFDFCKNYE
jgi:hypothetical protein